jgi:hypothetical protein
MSKYFTQYRYISQAKNKAEKTADAWCKTLDGFLLDSTKGKDKFIEDVITTILHINRQYPRCADITVQKWDEKWDDYPDRTNNKEIANEYLLIASHICQINIYPVKREISSLSDKPL